jgi:hypothetical protein
VAWNEGFSASNRTRRRLPLRVQAALRTVQMSPRTLATLRELGKADWFSTTGARDSDAVIFVTDWGQAMQHCSSLAWKLLCLEAANQYRQCLAERSPERFRRWNQVAGLLKQATSPLVKQKIKAAASRHGLPSQFEEAVQRDILHACMEAEYADVFPPGFYASQAYWYFRGHFPCGWAGVFPQGQLVVY